MNKREAFKAVCDYANGHADEIADYRGLTYEKIYRRGEIDEGESQADEIVFEVERHEGILGCEYYVGQPMDSYVTYWQRFRFTPKTETLTLLPESRKCTVSLDVAARAEDGIRNMFSLGFEPDDGGILCTESCCNSMKVVSNIDDVRKFATEFVAGLSFDCELEGISDYLSAGEEGKLLSEIRDAYERAAIDSAESDWNDFQKELVEGD